MINCTGKLLYCTGKLVSDSVSNHQVTRANTTTSPNGNVFTPSQFGTNAAGTPLRGTINIKLSSSSHGNTSAALHGGNTASSLAGGEDSPATDSEETNSRPRRIGLLSSADSSSSPAQVLTSVELISCCELV